MKTIDMDSLAGVTGGAGPRQQAIGAVQGAVISQAGHAGLLDFSKNPSVARQSDGLRVCGSFSVQADGSSHNYCGTYDPHGGSPSPDINVGKLQIH